MSTNDDESQAQVVSSSNKILEVTVESQLAQEQSRVSKAEAARAQDELAPSRAENAALAQRAQAMEDELADSSSSLVDEANQQVSEANRRVAAAHRLVDERDDVIASQAAESLASKSMLEAAQAPETAPLAVRRARPTDSHIHPTLGGLPHGGLPHEEGQASPTTSISADAHADAHADLHAHASGASGASGDSGASGFSNTSNTSNAPPSPSSTSIAASTHESSSVTPRLASTAHFGSPALAAASPRSPSTGAGSNSSRRVVAPVHGEITKDLILDLDAYASPTRPLIRTDSREFFDFMDAWGSESQSSAKWNIFQLQQEPWRRSAFVQRVIREDIEPTVRVGEAVHSRYLGIRSFSNSILDSTIALEPVSAKEQPWARRPSQPCLLCGESRPDAIYERSYWAHVPREAEPVVLDSACVAKTRLACELVGFSRHIARREPADDAQKVRAWRQCNSMREQSFWARTGGSFPDAPDALAAIQAIADEDFDFGVNAELDAPAKKAVNPPKTVGSPKTANAKGASKEASKDASKDVSKDANKDVSKDANKDANKDVSKGANKDANKDASKGASVKSAGIENADPNVDVENPDLDVKTDPSVDVKNADQSVDVEDPSVDVKNPNNSKSKKASIRRHGSGVSRTKSGSSNDDVAGTSANVNNNREISPKTSPEPALESARPYAQNNASVDSELDFFQEANEHSPRKSATPETTADLGAASADPRANRGVTAADDAMIQDSTIPGGWPR